MPLGVVRTDLRTTGTSYRNGTPINTSTHNFGNVVNWTVSSAHFGNILPVSNATFYSNPVYWAAGKGRFGNNLSILSSGLNGHVTVVATISSI